MMKSLVTCVALASVLFTAGCSSTYYNTLEKFGYAKRDVLV
ncbi:MAG: DUF2959 domain-containing protein, partial [Opitutaceae bacterium]|nr:DUF2959 domain-containing protein [Opitutaceae bacterium]